MAATETRYCYRHPDRETGLSCSECGRPICVDCMTVAPVGIRCPDHAGVGRARVTPKEVVRRASHPGTTTSATLVTRILVAANVIVYLITVAQGSGINDPGGSLFYKWVLFGPSVANGDWWRLITAAFLHGGIIHIAFNMLALWWLGGPVEVALGHMRFLLLYFVSALAGSAGALLINPNALTVGASGAIFGMLGAGLILEWRATGKLAGNYMTLIVINLVFSFAFPGVSYGGHIGGLIGGLVGTVVIIEARRFRGYETAVTVAGLIAIGVLSIIVAYSKVKGLS
jgi:membrane associated rhomboid family serine protease